MTGTYYPYGPIEIRDGTFDRVQKTGLFKTVYKARTLQLQADAADDQLPNATIFNLGEEREAMGDPNCGPPQFFHHLRLGIEITTVAGTEENLDDDVVQLVEHTIGTLLSDSTWVALWEGIHQCNVDYNYSETETNQYLCHAKINIVVSYRSIWDPNTPYEFKSIAFATPAKQYDTPVYVEVDLKNVQEP